MIHLKKTALQPANLIAAAHHMLEKQRTREFIFPVEFRQIRVLAFTQRAVEETFSCKMAAIFWLII
jgi:hypothetical protein